MRLILLLVVPVFGIAVVVFLVLWVPLPAPVPEPFSAGRNLAAAVMAGMLGVVYLVAIAFAVVGAFGAKGRALDEVAERLGLSGHGSPLTGRSYGGVLGNRPVAIRFQAGPPLKASRVEVEVAVSLPQRAAIGRGRPLLDCRDCAEVAMPAAAAGGLSVFCADRDWALRALTPADRWALVERTLTQGAGADQLELYLQPERLWLRWHWRSGSLAETEGRLRAMIELARSFEVGASAQSAPQIRRKAR